MRISEKRKTKFNIKMGGVPTWILLFWATTLFTQYAHASEPRVVCYYTNWSVYRPGTARFNPQNINPYLCTHLIYAFGGFTKDNTLKPFDKYQDIEKGGYAKFTGLKTYNNRLKTMLAIGGWNEGSSRFSPMVASRERRKEFVRNAIKFLRQNRFDGLDLDWEYPAFRDGGKPKDRDNYARLVRELREEFDREAEKTGKPRLLLTMAVPAGIEYIQKGFDVKTLNEHLDWMNLLSYDYHSAFEPAVNHHAPLYPLEEPNEYSVDNELNIDYTIQFYLENGADRDKIVLGIPTYGRSYTLFNPDATELGAPADGPGEQGDATREKGYLAYYEICESLLEKPKKKKSIDADDEDDSEESEEEEDVPWTVVQPNPSAMGPVAYKGNQWVGYDDIDIVKKKAEYVAEKGLGGIMFWSIDNDDFRGKCHGKPYPLIEAAKEAYISKLGVTDNAITSERQTGSSRRRARPSTSSPANTPRAAAKRASTTPAWSNTTPEPPTTPDPGSDFKCVDEGFFEHPRDCKKYFWCLDSGPSNLGIVAHQFTCPSGLFFNKAADSCDFSRNVLCKKSAATTSTTARPSSSTKPATSTNQPRTSTTSRPLAAVTTTRRPNKLTSKNSVYFRTTTTTIRPVVDDDEVYEDEIIDDVEAADVDSEDPKVIKELIDLIKKAGGVEQLERHLKLSGEGAAAAGTTTPLPISKKLYQKVLDHARQAGNNNYLDRYNSVSRDSSPSGQNSGGSQSGQNSGGRQSEQSGGGSQSGQNSRRGPQNAGIGNAQDSTSLRRDRPQYTTINRSRPASTSEEPQSREEAEEQDARESAAGPQESPAGSRGTAAKPLPQYVNIRRARPTTLAPADDSAEASRNALFERNEGAVVSQPSPSSLLHTPEYVTIRRSRPTTQATQEPTTAKYQTIEREKPVYEEVEEEDTPQPPTTPHYSALQRARGTPATPDIPLTSPEPTTVLTVQISSLLNSPVTTEPDRIQTTESRAAPEPETTEPATSVREPSTTEPVTTTAASSTSVAPRRNIPKRVRSTTTTTPGPSSAAPQVSSERNYNIIRRRRPNEISSDSGGPEPSSRKIRSTTPDSRETAGNVRSNGEVGVVLQGSRNRLDRPAGDTDSVAAAAAPISRGRFRPNLSRDEAFSLTPAKKEIEDSIPLERNAPRPERKFRPRARPVTPGESTPDTEASAATVEVRRPDFIRRGHNRFVVTSSTEGSSLSIDPLATDLPKQTRKPAFSRFTPRPFSRFASTAAGQNEISVNEDVPNVTEKIIGSTVSGSPVRLPFGRTRTSVLTSQTIVPQARNAFPLLRQSSSMTEPSSTEDDTEDKIEDIHLSESTIEEKEHEDTVAEEQQDVPRRRVVIKKARPIKISIKDEQDTDSVVQQTSENDINISSVTPSDESVTVDDSGRQKKFRIIKRRPISATTSLVKEHTETLSQDTSSASPVSNRIRKIIRKKIISHLPDQVTEISEKNHENIDDRKTNVTVVLNYGEKAKPIVFSAKTATITTENFSSSEKSQLDSTETLTVDEKSEDSFKTSLPNQDNLKPDFPTSSASPLQDIENNEQIDETESEKVIDLTEPTTKSTATSANLLKSKFERAQYRPQKRLFTTSTETSATPSSRTYSRKYSGAAYTSPLIPDREATERTRAALVTRRPLFTSKPFLRKPFTVRTTKKIEDDYNEEESEEEIIDEPETPLVLVPANQLFSRGTQHPNADGNESETIDEHEEVSEADEEVPNTKQTSRKPFFKPKTINSNTFRTSTSTTEIPKRSFSNNQNRTLIYNKSIFSRPNSNDTKKRTQNIPIGYNAVTLNKTALDDVNETNEENIAITTPEDVVSTTYSIVETEETSTADENLTDTTIGDNEDVDSKTIEIDLKSTNSDENLTTATESMVEETNTDDYLESIDKAHEAFSTENPTTAAQHVFSETETDFYSSPTESSLTTYFGNTNDHKFNESELTTIHPEVAPVIQTHYDKLFSVSRVVEVSSKLDKHRINKYNESRLVETGQVMQEQKPTVNKIGEVSRFTLIKIVEDDIPIYLTKLGHVYPVDNPPNNPIRIDEGRNARALVNFMDAGRENLVASESVNEAYRHVKKIGGTAKLNEDKSNPLLEFLTRDRVELNDNKTDQSEESVSYAPYPVQWQFVPAAYENDYTKEKNNKDAKTFEVITPRSYKTDPSTIALEGLFKTENPLQSARKVLNSESQGSLNNHPFVVYAAPRSMNKDSTNFVKLQVLKPEIGRNVKTFVRGQEFSGVSEVDQTTFKYPVSISILSSNTEKYEKKDTTTTTDLNLSKTEVGDSPTIVTEQTMTVPTLLDLFTATDFKTTTNTAETTTEPVVTTPKQIVSGDSLVDNAKKRPKLTFPRRPNFRNTNITRLSISPSANPVVTPRILKKGNSTLLTNAKSNKTSGFNPNKSRFSANRSQNVPVDLRSSKKVNASGTGSVRQNSTDFVRVQSQTSTVDSSRKLYFKPIRPNLLRPSFVPRRASTSTQATTQTTRRSFPRRTRPSPPQDPPLPAATTAEPEVTSWSTRFRNGSKFDKKRTPATKISESSKKSAVDAPREEGRAPEGFRAKKRPSLLENEAAGQATGAVRRPTRTYVRRRPGGGGANATSTIAPDPTTTSRSSTEPTRRPFRVVGRRRTPSSTAPAATSPAPGAPAPTTTPAAEDKAIPSHDLAVQESMEKENNEPEETKPRPHSKKTVKIQRRPLTSRKDSPAVSPSPPAPAEDKKREGKKFSASFKQNQLDEVIRQKSGERSEESTQSLEELSVDTAIAIAAHQLLGAPLPSTPLYEDETEYSPRKSSTAKSHRDRAPSTESYAGYANSKDYSARSSYPSTAYTDAVIHSSTPLTPAGFSSSSTVYSRGSTSAAVPPSSSPVYSRGQPSSPVYTRGSTLAPGLSSSASPVYDGGSSPYVPSKSRYFSTTNKYVSIPIDDFGYSTDSYTSGFGNEPAYFTRDYLMESPLTRKYETDYQYLTTELPSTRIPKRPSAFKRISTTVAPSPQSLHILPPVTPQPRRHPDKGVKVYDKLPKTERKVTYRPILNYDYYDEGDERLLERYPETRKVLVHENGNIECLDRGNFPHPASCSKFVSCARMESGALVGWEYVCPRGLSYDPVGAICNWSAGLGCNES